MPIISGRLVILLVYAAAVACSWSSNADISCTLSHSTPFFRSGNLLDQLSRVLNQLKAILDYQKWQPQCAFLQYTKSIKFHFSSKKSVFHLLVVAGHTAGIFIDPDLLRMTTTLSVAGCLFVEGFRVLISKRTPVKPGITMYKAFVIVSPKAYFNLN